MTAAANLFVKPVIKKVRPFPSSEDEMLDEARRAMEPRAVSETEGDLLSNVVPTPNRTVKGSLIASAKKQNLIRTRAEMARSLLGREPR